jgi:hypothetical protein
MKTNDPTYLGTVQDVKGPTVTILLDSNTLSGFVYINGHAYRIGQIGTFVKICIGYINLFGVISQVGAGSVPKSIVETNPHGYRWMTVQIIGESQYDGLFNRGLSQYPTIGDAVHIVVEEDLKKIYGHPDNPQYIKIGHLAGSDSIPALIEINSLINHHCAVLGSTGSGKSTTVAGLLASISDTDLYPSARILIFDIHGEYTSALKDLSITYKVNPTLKKGEKPLYVPYWAMTFDEFIPLTFGQMDDVNRGRISEKIMSLKLETLKKYPLIGINEDSLTVDLPVPFSIHQLWLDLYKQEYGTHTAQSSAQTFDTLAYELDINGRPVQIGDPIRVIPPKFRSIVTSGDRIYLSAIGWNIRRQVDFLTSRLHDPRYNFIFKAGPFHPDTNGEINSDLNSLLKDWLGSEKAIKIFDLSGIPNSVINNLISALLRIVYDSLFWARNTPEGGRMTPLLLVLEEAHNYLNEDNLDGASSAVKRIIKEGRKYGIGVILVSQRPSEINSTILSQCGTIIALRIANSKDRSQISTTVSENLEGLFDMLPTLRKGEAIIVGEAVQIPVRTLIYPPSKDRKPDSDDPVIFNQFSELPGGWNKPIKDSNYENVLQVWRQQNPNLPQIKTNIATKTIIVEDDRKMNRSYVESSNISSIGYDLASMTLEVEFTSGQIYQYFNVPEQEYTNLMSAPSTGSHFSHNIKNNYQYVRL